MRLASHVERVNTETEFAREIRAGLERLDSTKQQFEAAVQADESHRIGALHRLLQGGRGGAGLWQVRHQVTAASLLEWLDSTGRTEEAPTLVRFLRRGELVEVLPSLPAILRLQTALVDSFHRSLSLAEVEEVSIREFICVKFDASGARAMTAGSEALLAAWNRLSGKARIHGGNVLAAELARPGWLAGREIPDRLDLDNTPAAFLFPAARGRGLCSLVLVSLLVETHNSLVESELPPVAPRQATAAHLATLTGPQVQSLLLAHTRHSLEGGALREELDIPGMERRVRDRYVRGRPRLLPAGLPRLLYLEERAGGQPRLATRLPQEQLGNSAQHQVEQEVKMLPDLCRLLDSAQTAREFLLSAPGAPDQDLPALLARLRLHRGEGGGLAAAGGPLRGISVAHLDSLVDFLWFVRAKRMIRNKQNVFEQVIPAAYCLPLPPALEGRCRETLTRVPHTWLLPALFGLVWERLRTEPTGDTASWPDWPLKLMFDGEEQGEQLPEEVLVKHSVAFFLGLCRVMDEATQ